MGLISIFIWAWGDIRGALSLNLIIPNAFINVLLVLFSKSDMKFEENITHLYA